MCFHLQFAHKSRTEFESPFQNAARNHIKHTGKIFNLRVVDCIKLSKCFVSLKKFRIPFENKDLESKWTNLHDWSWYENALHSSAYLKYEIELITICTFLFKCKKCTELHSTNESFLVCTLWPSIFLHKIIIIL